MNAKSRCIYKLRSLKNHLEGKISEIEKVQTNSSEN